MKNSDRPSEQEACCWWTQRESTWVQVLLQSHDYRTEQNGTGQPDLQPMHAQQKRQQWCVNHIPKTVNFQPVNFHHTFFSAEQDKWVCVPSSIHTDFFFLTCGTMKHLYNCQNNARQWKEPKTWKKKRSFSLWIFKPSCCQPLERLKHLLHNCLMYFNGIYLTENAKRKLNCTQLVKYMKITTTRKEGFQSSTCQTQMLTQPHSSLLVSMHLNIWRICRRRSTSKSHRERIVVSIDNLNTHEKEYLLVEKHSTHTQARIREHRLVEYLLSGFQQKTPLEFSFNKEQEKESTSPFLLDFSVPALTNTV